jgi:hypothetical protein
MVIHITKITRGNCNRRKERSTYTEQHHHHTVRVRSLQTGGTHDSYINISRATYTQTHMSLRR